MNPTCTQCGAHLPPEALECPVCRQVTAKGAAARVYSPNLAVQQAAYDQHRRVQTDANEADELRSAANQAFLYSLLSLVLCCVPGPQIAALMRYSTARALAKRLYAPVPLKATLGLVFSLASIVLGFTVVIAGYVEGNQALSVKKQRLAELDKLTMNADVPTMSHELACALAEQYALNEGYDDHSGDDLSKFSCAGKLSSEPERAELVDFRFRDNEGIGDASFNVSVCFKRGTRWYVSEFSHARCPNDP